MNFKSVPSLPNFPALEEEVLAFWQKDNTFQKSIDTRPADKTFSFYDGPPFATGLPHYGHLMQSTLKDLFPRFFTMKGFRVERVWGWDTHGLPIEVIVEEELKIKNKKEIEEKYGVKKYCDLCRARVMQFSNDWRWYIDHIGRWADVEHAYKTYDVTYMESIWWAFKTLYEKKLIYEGRRSIHICPRCATPLSQVEVSQGYKDIKDITVYAKFKIKGEDDNLFALAWTTTPWTLAGNLSLGVDKNEMYVKVKVEGSREKYLVAKKRISQVFDKEKLTIEKEFKGKELIGLKYEPLFKLGNGKNDYQIYHADFVSMEEGTGLVHIAPAFGEDDYAFGQEHELSFIQHINIDGTINEKLLPVYQNFYIEKFNTQVVNDLNRDGKIFKSVDLVHSYPHCWRCGTKLIQYAISSWFVDVPKIKDKLLAEAEKIHWIPAHVKEGRFGQWLMNAKVWSISRNRYWGTPLPVWKCDKCLAIDAIGSREELKEKSGQFPDDLHKYIVDNITYKCSCGGTMKRIGDVFDCWFESGSMPYAHVHYPFENKEKFEKNFPADFVGESIEQTTLWFYTMHVLSVAIFGTIGYKNCVCTGTILAEDGSKMSKSKRNYPDPGELLKRYGGDAVRFYIASSPTIKGETLNFSEKGVMDVVRQIFLPVWNCYEFFQKNYEVDRVDLRRDAQLRVSTTTGSVLDQWILSRLQNLVKTITNFLDAYDIYEALKPVRPFVEDLSAWYIRRSRDRVGVSAKQNSSAEQNSSTKQNSDKKSFYETTYVVLSTLAKLLAPFTPFFSEIMWQNLGNEGSVHLQEWPIAIVGARHGEPLQIDEELEKQMNLVRKICELGQAKRKELKIKVRQPLRELKIKNYELGIVETRHGASGDKLQNSLLDLIKAELNVKNIEFVKGKDEMEVEYDTIITDDLRREGEARDLIRELQGLRKKAGLQINEWVNAEVASVPQGFEEMIKKEVLIKELRLKKDKLDKQSIIKPIKT